MYIDKLVKNVARATFALQFNGWRALASNVAVTSFAEFRRTKYTQHKGIKGIRNRKHFYEAQQREEQQLNEQPLMEDSLKLEDREYDQVANEAMHVCRNLQPQNVLIIQPYVKWGAKRNTEVSPDDQLQEAEALIHSLPNWRVAMSLKVPLESLERKALFGTGKLEELKSLVHQLRSENGADQPLTCLFVSKGSLSFAQKRVLENEFKLPVMDRYSVVIQILRLHANSAEAKLQVAMAEIPYIWSQAKDANLSMARKLGYSLNDTQREILKTRERKLKEELMRIRSHRKQLRNKRQQKSFPVVAVVGYTNAGKTSLIKALTNEQTMQPRNQLFATLDVTAHAGMLPCNLEVIYMDTVGFMSDLPTGLIECFVATLEDAMLADVIVHVQDVSHRTHLAQYRHVETTLQQLAKNTLAEYQQEMPVIINVGNKIDLMPTRANFNDDLLLVSAKEQTGLAALLQKIEKQILLATDRRKLCIRIPNGGAEISWLYKNAAVCNMQADSSNAEYLLVNVVITERAMQQFRREFC